MTRSATPLQRPSCSKAFLLAWFAGAATIGLPITFIAAWVAVESQIRWGGSMNWLLIAAPLTITLVASAIGMVLVAIPVTKMLASRGAESLRAYALAGAAAGTGLGLVAVLVLAGWAGTDGALLFGSGGLLSGLVAGFIWGRHRLRLGEWRNAYPSAAVPPHPACTRTANPIHDLLY